MTIQRVTDADRKADVCRTILEALPDWFGIPEAITEYVNNVREQPFWVVLDGEDTIGFIALTEHNRFTSEINLMGVLPEYHRKGVGRLLVETAEQFCRENGTKMMLVKTLDFSSPDASYARTREFYLAMGYIPLQVLEGYWDEHNPCLLLGKCLDH